MHYDERKLSYYKDSKTSVNAYLEGLFEELSWEDSNGPILAYIELLLLERPWQRCNKLPNRDFEQCCVIVSKNPLQQQ